MCHFGIRVKETSPTASWKELASLELFESVDIALVEPLLRQAEVRTVAEGEVLIASGEPNLILYSVLSGSLGLHLGAVDEPAVTHFQAGETVGEMSLIEQQLSSASVVADSRCRVLMIDQPTASRLIEVSAAVSKNLMITLSRRLRAINVLIHQDRQRLAAQVAELQHERDTRRLEEAEKAKIAEKLLQATQQAAAEHASNQARCQFLATVSHELRTPMNAIIGLAHLAQQTELTEQQRDYLTKIDTASGTLMNMIESILDFTQIEAGSLELDQVEFNLPDLLRGIRNLFGAEADNVGLGFRVAGPEYGQVGLLGDPRRLKQVLAHLIANAFKFTERGEVIVVAEPCDARQAGYRSFQFAIQDTGIGMAQAQLKTLFLPFSQVGTSISRRYGGAGLGLAICHRLVELMGGRITVESRPGEGSRFSFRLTFPEVINVERTAPIQNQPGIGPSAVSFAGNRVLVAEDDAVNQQVIRELLLQFGIDADIVADGRQAVESALAGSYNLVLMDIQMPEIDGYQAAREIRRVFGPEQLPIVAVTAHASESHRKQAQQVGIEGYLTKPIDPGLLQTLLAKHLDVAEYRAGPTESPARSAVADPHDLSAIQLPGIDTRAGLARLRHNAEAYQRTLQVFFEDHRDDINLIAADLAVDGKAETAVVRAHSLKGAAGNVEATALHAAVVELERALRSKQPCSEILQNCRHEHDRVFAGLKAWYRQQRQRRTDANPLPIDHARLGRALTALSERIDGRSFDFGQQLADVERALGASYPDQCEALQSALERFEFAAAKALIVELSRVQQTSEPDDLIVGTQGERS